MSIYKRGKKWYVDFYVNRKRIKKGGFYSKEIAEKYLIKTKNDIMLKKYAIPKDEKITFSEYSEKYIELHSIPNKKSYKTDISLLKKLNHFFGDEFIGEITREKVDSYRTERLGKNTQYRKPISKTTINRELALIRNMLNMAVEWRLITINPLGKLKLYREEPKERILTEKEMIKLISSAEGYLKNIILVALNTGMRKGEILNLKWDSVNLGKGYIETRSKTKKIRVIPMNSVMQDLFSRLSLNRGGRTYVFENPKTGKPFIDIKKGWGALLKRLKIDDLRFHDLRHCFATYTLLNGGDLISLKEILGHTQISTTVRYAKAMLEGQKRIVNNFNIGELDSKIIDFKKRNIK